MRIGEFIDEPPAREFDILWYHYKICPESREDFVTIERDIFGIRTEARFSKTSWVAINIMLIVAFLVVAAIPPLMIGTSIDPYPVSMLFLSIAFLILAFIASVFLAITLMPARHER